MATILVVDDNAMLARMLARFLEGKGHQAVIACSGAEALLAAGTRPPPDLILLDLCMPEMDGLEVLRRLRLIDFSGKSASSAEPMEQQPAALAGSGAAKPAHTPPVIFFSAIDDPAVIASAFQQGACDYWIKASFKFDDLPKAITRHLSDAR